MKRHRYTLNGRGIRTRSALSLLVFCFVSVPASAQEVSEFVREVDVAYAACQSALEANAPEVIVQCEAAAQTMTTLQAQYPDASIADKDYVWFSRVSNYLALGEAYGAVSDWPRFCEAAERSWVAAGEISVGSPEETNVGYIMPATLGAIEDCREFFPMPAWGVAHCHDYGRI